MNKSIAEKWAAALRSGKYKQAKETLRDGDAFCCLGVLCNLHAEAHPEFAKTQRREDKYDGATKLPSERVMKWADMKTADGWIPGLDTLAGLNDNGATFTRIAALISKHAEAL